MNNLASAVVVVPSTSSITSADLPYPDVVTSWNDEIVTPAVSTEIGTTTVSGPNTTQPPAPPPSPGALTVTSHSPSPTTLTRTRCRNNNKTTNAAAAAVTKSSLPSSKCNNNKKNKRNFEDMSQSDLIAELLKRNTEIAQLQKECKRLKRTASVVVRKVKAAATARSAKVVKAKTKSKTNNGSRSKKYFQRPVDKDAMVSSSPARLARQAAKVKKLVLRAIQDQMVWEESWRRSVAKFACTVPCDEETFHFLLRSSTAATSNNKAKTAKESFAAKMKNAAAVALSLSTGVGAPTTSAKAAPTAPAKRHAMTVSEFERTILMGTTWPTISSFCGGSSGGGRNNSDSKIDLAAMRDSVVTVIHITRSNVIKVIGSYGPLLKTTKN